MKEERSPRLYTLDLVSHRLARVRRRVNEWFTKRKQVSDMVKAVMAAALRYRRWSGADSWIESVTLSRGLLHKAGTKVVLTRRKSPGQHRALVLQVARTSACQKELMGGYRPLVAFPATCLQVWRTKWYLWRWSKDGYYPTILFPFLTTKTRISDRY